MSAAGFDNVPRENTPEQDAFELHMLLTTTVLIVLWIVAWQLSTARHKTEVRE